MMGAIKNPNPGRVGGMRWGETIDGGWERRAGSLPAAVRVRVCVCVCVCDPPCERVRVHEGGRAPNGGAAPPACVSSGGLCGLQKAGCILGSGKTHTLEGGGNAIQSREG